MFLVPRQQATNAVHRACWKPVLRQQGHSVMRTGGIPGCPRPFIPGTCKGPSDRSHRSACSCRRPPTVLLSCHCGSILVSATGSQTTTVGHLPLNVSSCILVLFAAQHCVLHILLS